MRPRDEMTCYAPPPEEQTGGNVTAALAVASTIIALALLLWAIIW